MIGHRFYLVCYEKSLNGFKQENDTAKFMF